MQLKKSNLRSADQDISESNDSGRLYIDLLFGSGARVDILLAYLQHSDKWLGPRELQFITGRSLSDIRRNNEILSKIGLINIYDVGENRTPRNIPEETNHVGKEHRMFRNHYILNNEHPWIPALRMLLERSIGSLNILQKTLSRLNGVEVAFVFGSYATSEQSPESDIDLMVIGDQTLMTLVEPISEVEKKVGREVSIVAYTPDEWRKAFEERSHFVVSMMEAPKTFLVGNQLKLDKITLGDSHEV
jgi:predicted nucleotidyltransferase